jgi:alpha-tubulin suppressor-like RCC1 family protein
LIDELTDLDLYDIKCGWSHCIAICKKIHIITSLNEVEIEVKNDNFDNKEYSTNFNNISERRVIIWGSIENCSEFNDYTELNIDEEYPKTIVSGFSHSIIVSTLGNAYAIGDNSYVSN